MRQKYRLKKRCVMVIGLKPYWPGNKGPGVTRGGSSCSALRGRTSNTVHEMRNRKRAPWTVDDWMLQFQLVEHPKRKI
ncbi:hypothetical protein E4U10_004898 [Claviceps purpurea]|nr:hypothetical protein E4U10_004898 [Claviceps purpurea]